MRRDDERAGGTISRLSSLRAVWARPEGIP